MVCPLLPRMKLGIWELTLGISMDLHIVITELVPAVFYGLNGIGLKYPGIKPQVVLDIFNICVNSILKYGCASIYCTSKNLEKLNKVQSKLIKQCLGLRMCCHTNPLLKAINILSISLNIKLESFVLKKCILSNSLAKYFIVKKVIKELKH